MKHVVSACCLLSSCLMIEVIGAQESVTPVEVIAPVELEGVDDASDHVVPSSQSNVHQVLPDKPAEKSDTPLSSSPQRKPVQDEAPTGPESPKPAASPLTPKVQIPHHPDPIAQEPAEATLILPAPAPSAEEIPPPGNPQQGNGLPSVLEGGVDDASDRDVLPSKRNVREVPQDASLGQSAPSKSEQQTPNSFEENKTFTSISASHQIYVDGQDRVLVSAMAGKADEIRILLLKILKQPNEWKNKIFIHLVGDPGGPTPSDPIRMQTVILENTISFEIFVHIGNGINQDRFRHSVIAALLYEMMLRNLDPEGLPDRVFLPPWMISGLEQAVLWNSNEADRTMYATLFRQDGIMSPEELFTADDPEHQLDATSYAAYQTSCGALMLCLLNQKNGPEGMKEMLDQSILGADDPVNLVKRHFPQLNLTPTSLHKWWALQLSKMAQTPLTESLSIPETERYLQEIISLVRYDPESRITDVFPLDQLEDALNLPDLNRQLSNVSSGLLNLSRRSFPSYRPVIIEYAKLAALMQSGDLDPAQVQPKINEMRQFRELAQQTAMRVRDYLDWFEINTRTGTGDSFSSYATTMRMLREKEAPANTPISRYLDDIEKLYTLPSKSPLPRMHASGSHLPTNSE